MIFLSFVFINTFKLNLLNAFDAKLRSNLPLLLSGPKNSRCNQAHPFLGRAVSQFLRSELKKRTESDFICWIQCPSWFWEPELNVPNTLHSLSECRNAASSQNFSRSVRIIRETKAAIWSKITLRFGILVFCRATVWWLVCVLEYYSWFYVVLWVGQKRKAKLLVHKLQLFRKRN